MVELFSYLAFNATSTTDNPLEEVRQLGFVFPKAGLPKMKCVIENVSCVVCQRFVEYAKASNPSEAPDNQSFYISFELARSRLIFNDTYNFVLNPTIPYFWVFFFLLCGHVDVLTVVFKIWVRRATDPIIPS